ncbi:MAG: hypothetical protein PHX78_10840 [bacterium]|nr:hypothetical protein [bacterium]
MTNKSKSNQLITCPECKTTMTEEGFKYFHIPNSHKTNYYDFMEKHGSAFNEGEDYVVCQICKEKCSRLSGGHLEKKHNMTSKAYSIKYPNDLLHSQNFSKKQKKSKESQYKNDPTLRQKVGKRTYKSELWQMLQISEPDNETNYKPKPLTDSIFSSEPTNENSVILLFGHLCHNYNLIIEELWTHKFPDCKALIKSKIKKDKYFPIYIEFEHKSSNIFTHEEIKNGSWKNTSPLCLVCWENDTDKIPKEITIIELKKEIKNQK